jgi:O-acetyl-ADP-ribose deacetylase (regulator of RNase III)
VIHTVGPRWRGGARGEVALLESCYRRVMGIARDQQFRTLGFPSISTGVYGFPVEQAAPIAVETVRDELSRSSGIIEVRFVCFSEADLAVYERLLGARPESA